jgi:hypothetical protein
MTLTPIHYKQGTLWVDDLAKITTGDKIAYKDGTCFKNGNIYHEVISVDERDSGNHRLNLKSERSLFTMSNDVRKIVAQQGCGIPDIPNVEIEEKANDIEILCNIIELLETCLIDAPVDFLGTGSNSREADREYKSWQQKWDTAIVIYKEIAIRAKTKRWSDEDLRKAYNQGCLDSSGWDGDKTLQDNFIQSLQPKITGIEIEMERFWDEVAVGENVGESTTWVEPVSYQKDGQTFYKVKKINNELD